MKYLELYEKNLNKPHKGDWVLLNFKSTPLLPPFEFMENHVGQIIRMDSYLFLIDFLQNIPGREKSCWWVMLENIEFFSSNKEDCEAFIATKKYNL